MKTNLLILTVYIFTFVACKEEVVEPIGNVNCDFEIGSYEILNSSFDAIPYYGKKKIVFEDSLGQLVECTISEVNSLLSGGTFIHYNVNEPGDTVRYCYSAQRKNFSIKNDSLEINFLVSLRSAPSYSDPQSGRVADLLEIYFNDLTVTPYKGYQVFSKMVDQRTYLNPFSSNELFATIQFHGEEFHNVEKTKFTNPELILYYNQSEGIVAFRDKTNKLWRFDGMN